MMKSKEVRILIKRINHNQFIVNNREYDFLQLVNWFKNIITE